MSAQLWDALTAQVDGVDDALAAGDCAPVRDWLREQRPSPRPHARPAGAAARGDGQRRSTPRRCCAYLRAKYGALYGLSVR